MSKPGSKPDAFTTHRQRFDAGRLGMWLFIASLAMLFGASVIGFLVIRIAARDAWPADLPPLPRTLWLSTLVLAISSATMQGALDRARRGRRGAMQMCLVATMLLGLGFLALQALSWSLWNDALAQRFAAASDELRFARSAFYVLTAVHAAHVIGGLVPMSVVTRRALAGRYGPDDHAGVHYTTMYWHFLGAVWLGLFGLLMLGT